jgi:hypothetical protein
VLGGAAAVPPALADSTVCAAMRYVAWAPTGGAMPSVATAIGGAIKGPSKLRPGLMVGAVVMACCLASGVLRSSGPQATREAPPKSGAVRAGAIAWGEAVDGLQLGLALADDGRPARLGESTNFVVWARNLRGQPAKLTYRAGWFYSSPPVVIDGNGQPAKVALPPMVEDVPIFDADGKKVAAPPQQREWPALELSVGPGESLELTAVAVALAPAADEGPVDRPTARLTPGAWRFRFRGISTSHPGLETGPGEIVVGRAAASGDEPTAGPLTAAAKRLVGSWQVENGGAGPTYHADGTGRNPDGSRFEWRLEGDVMVARRLPAQGRPGDWSRYVILFSRDAREYRLLLDKEYRFLRLVPGGEGGERRTEEGRSFPRRQVPKEDRGDAPEPAVREPGPGRGEVRTAPAGGRIDVGPNVHVSKANAGIFHAEVVLAADPTDARRLVAASMYQPPPVDLSAPKVVIYASSDGGRTWTPTLERKDANPASLADPAFAWGASDSLFFVNMWAPSLGRLNQAGCLQVIRSPDGGRTWGPVTTIGEYHDRPFLALDRSGGKHHGRLYCLTHRGLLVSTDSGRSFGPTRTWARRPGYIAYGSGNPLVFADGTLIVLDNNNQRETDRDRDRNYLGVRTSRDGGESFSEEVVVAEYRGAGYPTAASSPAHTPWPDRIHVVWQEVLPRGRRCVAYAHSKDRGATFSEPKVLSEQDEARGDHEAFVPSIAVNEAGVVAVAWYDTRGLQLDEAGWNLRLRASLDGGETWPPSTRLTEFPTLKDGKTRRRLMGVGHTAGLAADAAGVFHGLWLDGRGGVLQVYTAAVTVGPLHVSVAGSARTSGPS